MTENDDGTDGVLAMLRQAMSKSKETFSFERPVDGEKLTPEAQAERAMPSAPPDPPSADQEERAAEVRRTAPPAPPMPRKLPAVQVQEMILQGLRQIPDFPKSGVAVTVYGLRPWSAMLNFAPRSTSHQQAITLREALAEIVQVLRAQVEVDINDGE
jgi:hypothetical protein